MAETNGNEPPRRYLTAEEAALGERVSNLGRRLTDNEQETRSQINGLNTTLTSFMNETRTALASIAATIAGGGKPHWPALSVALGAIVVLGGLVYWPIRESTTDLKANLAALAIETNQSIRMLAEKAVMREEMDWRAARGAEDRARADKAIDEIRSGMLPRAEWAERNLSRDHDIENLRADAVRDTANLQRQIDLQRSDFQTFASSMGNGRDFITDMKSEIGRLRDQLAEIRARQYQRFNSTAPP